MDKPVEETTTWSIKLSEDFELGDVIEWTEGFNRLGKIWPMVVMKTKLRDGNYDDELAKSQTQIINDLITNQNFEITKVKH